MSGKIISRVMERNRRAQKLRGWRDANELIHEYLRARQEELAWSWQNTPPRFQPAPWWRFWE